MRSILLTVFVIFSFLNQNLTWAQGVPTAAQTAIQTADKYPVFPMKEGYKEKDIKKGVVQFTEAQREQRRVVIVNGLVYDKQGLVPDTNHKINYVMDKAGNFYLFDESLHPEIRHSSIFSGGPVAAAGDIHFSGGHITWIDLNSGHYFVLEFEEQAEAKPNLIEELRLHGVDTKVVN